MPSAEMTKCCWLVKESGAKMDLNSKKSGFRFSNPELVHLEYETNQSFCEESEIQLRINLSTDVKPYEGKSKAEVILTITLGGKTEKDPFYLEASEQATFDWSGSQFSDEALESLLSKNAPSLLLSYLRPIVASSTNWSRYGSYNIPFIDFTKAVKESD